MLVKLHDILIVVVQTNSYSTIIFPTKEEILHFAQFLIFSEKDK